jgi:hypothetical protein
MKNMENNTLHSIHNIDWKLCEKQVFQVQKLIAMAWSQHDLQRVNRKLGGKDKLSNLALLHATCHLQLTHSKSPTLRAQWLKQGLILERSQASVHLKP